MALSPERHLGARVFCYLAADGDVSDFGRGVSVNVEGMP